MVPIEEVEEWEELGGVNTRDGDKGDNDPLTSRQAHYLYISHSLSMWTSRMYEFAVVIAFVDSQSWTGKLTDVLTKYQILFIQAAFPGDLTATSIK